MSLDNAQILKELQEIKALPPADIRKIFNAFNEAGLSVKNSRKGKRQVVAGGRIAQNSGNISAVAGAKQSLESSRTFTFAGRGGKMFALQAHLANFSHQSAGTVNGLSDLLISACMLTPPVGNARTFFFNSQKAATVAAGAWIKSSNKLNFSITPNQKAIVRMGLEAPSGQAIIGGSAEGNATIGDACVMHTDAIMSTTPQGNITAPCNTNAKMALTAPNAYAPTNGANATQPIHITYVTAICEEPAPCVAVLGDSIAQGTGDNDVNRGGRGFLEKAGLEASLGVVPVVNLSRSGSSLSSYNLGQSAQLFQPLEDCTHYIQQMGSNSVSGNLRPTFTGNGVLTNFTLPYTPTSKANILDITVNGTPVLAANYSLSGAVITFATAPASGSSNNIVVNINGLDQTYVEQSLAAMKVQATRALQDGKGADRTTILVEIMPRTTDSSNVVVANGWQLGGLCDQYNAWLRSIIGAPIDDNGNFSLSGSVVADIFWYVRSAVCDPLTNLWLSSSLTSDGVHPSTAGHDAAALWLRPYFNALTA